MQCAAHLRTTIELLKNQRKELPQTPHLRRATRSRSLPQTRHPQQALHRHHQDHRLPRRNRPSPPLRRTQRHRDPLSGHRFTHDFQIVIILSSPQPLPRSGVLRLSPETEVITRSLGNKPAIFGRGPDVAKALVETDKCDLVMIVWDLKPQWEKPGSCKTEATTLRLNFDGLPAATKSKISLLCLTFELEAWLLTDDAAVRDYLSKEAHPCTWQVSKPASYQDAKAQLNKVFSEFRGRRVDRKQGRRLPKKCGCLWRLAAGCSEPGAINFPITPWSPTRW